jgi:thiamine biosynthesis lipoprotein ApbE
MTSPRSGELGHATWEALGTTVVLRVTDPRALAPARAAVEWELDAIDLACSRFREDSELSRLNANAGRPMRATPLLIEAVEEALRAAELTDGDVDPTLGAALEMIGYDRDWRLLDPPREESPRSEARPHRPRAGVPSEDSRRREDPRAAHPDTRVGLKPTITIRARAGWREVALDRASFSLCLPAGIHLDLGATAKAWAADRAAGSGAREVGCGVLVSLGGDLATCGPPPLDGWQIHVTDDHRSDPRAPGQTISILSGGLATSSTTVRRWHHDGCDMHHIVDPHTAAPVRGAWRTVSVAAASCLDANIATTAALVRGELVPAWLAELGLPARLVDRDGNVMTLGDWPLERALERALAA